MFYNGALFAVALPVNPTKMPHLAGLTDFTGSPDQEKIDAHLLYLRLQH